MLSFNDPEDELLFALFLPCGTLLVALLALAALPIVACYCGARLARHAGGRLANSMRQVVSLAVPESHGDRVVF